MAVSAFIAHQEQRRLGALAPDHAARRQSQQSEATGCGLRHGHQLRRIQRPEDVPAIRIMHLREVFLKISMRLIECLASAMQHERSDGVRLTIAAGALRALSRSVPDALIAGVGSRNDIAH